MGHCLLEEVSQSSKISVLFISAINFCDFFAELMNFFSVFQVLQERLLVRVILELLNQLFDRFFTIRVLLLDCRKRYARNPVIDASARCLPVASFSIRSGGLRIFLLLDQVDPVVHFANSVSA